MRGGCPAAKQQVQTELAPAFHFAGEAIGKTRCECIWRGHVARLLQAGRRAPGDHGGSGKIYPDTRNDDAFNAFKQHSRDLGTPDQPGARVKLMAAWGRYCANGAAGTGNVVPLPGKKAG